MSLVASHVHVNYERIVAKERCESQHLFFTRYFFRHRQNQKFRINWHHKWIADVIEQVIKGHIKNLVINVPPGSSKTEEAVINLIARGLAINPHARFLHLSYSDDLASLNSHTTREIIASDEYQELWPIKIADDSKSKKRWNVVVNNRVAGGVYATSLQGQVTGFRAGHMSDGFQGAIIIDDPLKPEDAFSKPKLGAANRRLLTTVKSRKANPDTPIILIMQRIAEMDPTGFIRAGNLQGVWHHVVIPALLDDEFVKKNIPQKYWAEMDKSERDEKGRFSYWPYKERLQDLVAMERGDGSNADGSRISRHVFAAQYDQNPRALGGNMFRSHYFPRYKVLPKIVYRKIFADTAQKTKERNDYSVFHCVGMGVDGKAYSLDLIRGKWEAPELERRATAFWQKHSLVDTDKHGSLREMKVEDKSSGTGLIQSIKTKNTIPIKGVERNKDKLVRANDALPYVEAGLFLLPEDAPYTNDFLEEAEGFTPDDTHDHDDQLDTLFDAVEDMLSTANKLRVWEQVANGKKGI